MSQKPLAERIRPQTLDDLIGQEHLVGINGVLRRAIESGGIPSMILWGPPGVGKTTIANIIANTVKAPFIPLSAISSGVKEIREVIQRAKFQSKTILFIDEIHRFNKSQKEDLLRLVESAIQKDKILSQKTIHLKETQALFSISGGDARKLLNLLDLVVENLGGQEVEITDDKVIDIAQQRVAIYDKSGEQHYDIISAFIKSIRGSDPNAAVYYLARMIEGGEDIKFIARRLVILASEDIGNANPTALVIATNAFQAVSMIGYPEGRIVLSQCVTYLAASAKSNAAYMAINQAQALVRQTGDLQVPLPIRNAPTKLMKEEGYGKGYKYSHDFPGNFVNQEFMPAEIKGTKLYDPGKNPREEEMRKRLQAMWKEKYGY